MTTSSKCPVCHEPITLPAATAPSILACPACGVRLTASEEGELVVEAIRPATTSNVAAIPKAPPKLDDAEDEWNEDVPRRPPWRRRYSRAAALRKVKTPAVILQIYGVLWILAGIALAAFGVISTTRPQPNDPDRIAAIAAVVGGIIFCLPVGVITTLAGARLKQLRSYVFVLAMVIVHFGLAVLTCIPAVIVPIWPFIVLVDSEVKAGFEGTKQQEAENSRKASGDDTEETERTENL